MPPKISFAEFEIDTDHRRLLRQGEVVRLHAKAFDLLTFLVRNNGNIVSKDEILQWVWDDKFVEESNLVVQVSNLRKALGETKNSPRFLVTVPGKGYKFVGDLDENLLIIETHSVTELTIEEEVKIQNPVSIGNKISSFAKIASIALAILFAIGIGLLGLRYFQPPPSKQMRFAKLTASGKIANIALSPDGNFAVFAQKEDNGESLWLRQMETGSEKRIVEPQPLNYVGLTISPDSQFIYASKFLKNEVDPVLEKISLLGGISQIIPKISSGSAISISPDGKRFAFTESFSLQKETWLGVSDVDGSNSRTLLRAKDDVRYFPIFYSSPLAWSPTQNEIAVAVTEKREKVSFDTILLVNPENGSERYLTDKRWRTVDNLAWIDDDKLAFTAKSEDGLQNQVWVFSRQTGEAKQLTNELKDYVKLAASGGKILTIQVSYNSSLRLVDFNESDFSLKIREIFTASEYIDEMDWSKDNEIVFSSQASGKNELWQMKNDGTNARQITTNANVSFGLTVSPVDGSIVFAAKQNGIRGIWQVDSAGKNLRQISEGDIKSPDISNDGKIIFQRGLGHSEGAFLNWNGETKILDSSCYFPSISPDGTKVACYFMDFADNRKWRIAIISTDSSLLINKITPPIPIYERHIRWHPSGKFITQIYSEGENLKLLFLPVEGGEHKTLDGLGKGESNVPEWSADGKQFLYPQITIAQDAVLLTDF